MTHYVVTLDWAIVEWDERASKIVGIAHSEEAAYKIFDSQLVGEQEFAKDWRMKVVENTPTCFEAVDDKDNFVCLYIQKVDSNDDEKENNPMNEILERLRKGETEEAIAAEFTAKLNEAAATLRAEDTKGEDTEALLEHINEYFEKYYPNVPTDLCVKDFINTLDALVGTYDSLLKADPKDLNLGDIWKLFA